MSLRIRPSLLLLAIAMLAGCKNDDDEACTIGDACEGGLVCEAVQGGEPACFAPVVIRGEVFDALDDSAIEGADVVALDANGQAVTLTATTAADGSYELQVPTIRDADGNVVEGSVTLRVDADTYVPFPKPPRFAIPVDLTVAVVDGDVLVVDNPTTDVALFEIEDTSALGTITGHVSGDGVAGALVVAEQGGEAVATAIVDSNGDFTLYNVPIGVETTIVAYATGVHTPAATATVASDGETVNVSLAADEQGLGTVSGSLSPVNAPNFSGTDPTSVLLVVESTFSELTRAGYSPAGMRQALRRDALSFSIEGVPPGVYVVLAAFENDDVVRDPDLSQGGTSFRHIQVDDSGVVTSLLDPISGTTEDLGMGIKITDALATVFPGANGLEVVTTTPTFEWGKDSGADHYEFRIFDAYGELVYEDTAVPQPGGAGPVAYDLVGGSFLIGSALVEGMIYQFRAESIETGGDTISTTEDLRGVFQFQP